MKLAPQPVRRDLRAKPAPPNLSICAQCACIDPAISTSRTLAKNCRAVSVSLSRFFRYRSSDAKRNASKPFRMNTCESVSKQRTLTTFRMNTYEKPRGGGRGPSLGGNRATQDLLEVCDRDLRHFLRQVVCGSQISADKPHIACNILRELGFAGLVRKQAVHLDLRSARNRRHLALPLAAVLKPVHVAVQDHEVGVVRRSRVAVAVHVLELFRLLHLFDQVLVQRQLKFNGQLHFVGLDGQNLDRGRLNLCGYLVLRQCRAPREKQRQGEWQQGAHTADQ